MTGYRPTIAGDGAAADLPVIDDLDEIVAFVEHQPQLYVRYSEGPDRDREGPSRDYESELTLPGLCVTSLRIPSWWKRPAREWVARRLCKYAKLMRAARQPRPWLLAGIEVGVGPDHEPLIAEAVPLAWVGMAALAQAEQIYRDGFVVGRDSRWLPARSSPDRSPGPADADWLVKLSGAEKIDAVRTTSDRSIPSVLHDSRCPFCFPAAIAPQQLLITTEHFYLLAPVGQMVGGFLAVMTHACSDAPVRMRCLDDIPAHWAVELNALKVIITSFYREVYRAPALLYEHGRGGGHRSSLPQGDFVFHPHLCALPGNLEIHEPLRSRYSYLRAPEFPTVRRSIGRRPYIYVETPDAGPHRDPVVYFSPDGDPGEDVATLSVKTLLAEVNSLGKDAAWRRYPGERELADLVDQFNFWYATTFRRSSDPRLAKIVAPRHPS